MEVFVYRGLTTVPTIDFNCLRTLALIKLCNAPVKITTSANPFHSPNGSLPYMRTEDGRKIAGYTRIAGHLTEEGYCQVLSQKQAGLSDGYITLLGNHLYACLQYYLWGDPLNGDHTRQMYAKRTAFPFNFYYPQSYIRATDRLMQSLENFSLDDKLVDHDTAAMLLDARKCLNQFEQKITGSLTALDAPTELDATLYAYVATIQCVLPHNNVLRTHLNECKRLMQFMQRFRTAYFPAADAISAGQQASAALAADCWVEEQRLNGTATTQDMDDASSSKWMPKALAAAIAFGAMSLFAYRQGIVQSARGSSDDADYGLAEYTDDDDDANDGNDDD